jgi:hypothetical protein
VNDLWDAPDVKPVRRSTRSATAARHIGCPLSWFRLVFPIVHGKNELAVALFLYRQRVIQRSQTVVLTNVRLAAELGIDRHAKYRTLRRLADAGSSGSYAATKGRLRSPFAGSAGAESCSTHAHAV